MDNPTVKGIDTCESIANYLKAKLASDQAGDDARVPYPRHWDLEALHECDQLIETVKLAATNKKTTKWSAEEYMDFMGENFPKTNGAKAEIEEYIESKFDPELKEHSTMTDVYRFPFVLVDPDDNILLWYLPDALQESRQRKLFNSLEIISPLLSTVSEGSWRQHQRMFDNPEHSDIQPGTVSLAPAWFQQGHEKSKPLEVSASLRTTVGLSWLQSFEPSMAFIGAALSIMHPKLYNVGVTSMRSLHENRDRVSKNENLDAVLESWCSPFTSLSIMSNCHTPIHRDNGGGFNWMDLLVSVGDYKDGILKLPGVGMKLKYNSGTMVGICGRLLRHGATKKMGNKVCFAFYMKRSVIGALSDLDPGWANLKDLDNLL